MTATQNAFSRKKPDQLVYLELGSGNGGMLLSLSEDGFRFRAVSPLRPEGLVPFAFSLDGKARLQGVGEIEWLEDDGKSGGMRFVEVSPDSRSAIDRWLAADSARSRSEREAAPAAATPLDTMEKIREELRRGYPQRPASPSAPSESRDDSSETPKAAPAPPSRETRLKPSLPDQTNRMDRSGVANRPTRTDRPPKQSAKERGPAEHARTEHAKADQDRSSTAPAKPFYPPPFTHAAEPESSPAAETPSSAFLKKPVPPAPPAAPRSEPAESSAERSAFSAPQYVAPPEPKPEPPQPREQAEASADALRRPFRAESRLRNSERPYIPPADESFEPSYDSAWERAKLTAPPEPPHLSRAAAGSIIGVALAVILGALAFNFRQDIGELVIAAGQRISGESHNASPVPSVAASENKTEPQPNAASGGTEPSGALNKPDTTAPQTGATRSGVSNGNDSHAADSPAPQSAASGTPHDASSGAPREGNSSSRTANAAVPRSTTSDRPTSAATNGNASAASRPDNSATAAAAQVPAGSGVTSIGTESGSGAEEFNAAREMLKGDHKHRDLTSAVNLLWAGVRKGYVPAEVTLADLYRRGDGVAKNCDQAQVLLVAASKKGSPEARQLLEQMAEQGCTE